MAATGKTPILLYGSTTATNTPVAGNLTNSSDGCEIAINVADKNLFFKDSTNAVNTVPIRQSSGSSDGWLSSANWTTFNSKQAAYTNLTTIGSLANATGWLYNNGSGTFSYSTPSASDVGAVPTTRTISTTSPLAGGGDLSANRTFSITQATTSTNGYLSSTDWNTFNNKQPAGSYALTTGTLAQFASTTSAQLASVISNETGTGLLVFNTSPSLVTPSFAYFSNNPTDVQNKSFGLLYEGTNGGMVLGTGYATSFLTYSNGGTTGNVAYTFRASSYFQVASGITALVGTTFTVGANTYTVTNTSSNGYVYVTPDPSGETATGTLTNLKYTNERIRVDASGNFIVKSGNISTSAGSITSATTLTATSGNITATNGNLVIGTSGKGIDFSATAGTGTSELLADYEEGTWTPTDASGAGLTLTASGCTYVKIGKLVTLYGFITYPATASAATVLIGGIPYANATNNNGTTAPWTNNSLAYTVISTLTQLFLRTSANADLTNAQMSGKFVGFSVTYQAST